MASRVRRRSNAVTIQDVAQRAGVAAITVSRALNTPERVSPLLRQRIQQAVSELNYRPNPMAGALASARSQMVPLIVPSLSNMAFLDVVRGSQESLEQAGYQALLTTTEYDLEREAKALDTLLAWVPAGLIVAGLRHHPHSEQLLREFSRPVVEVMELDDRPEDEGFLRVGFSHRQAGAVIGEHFLAQGYRRIAYVSTQRQRDHRAAQRYQGLRQVLLDVGLESPWLLELAERSTFAGGGEALHHVLANWPGVEAIFFANDDLAVGALLAAQRAAIPVPERVAIAGFNGFALGEQLQPRLTTIVSPRYRIGQLAAELLVRASQELPLPERVIDVGFELRIGDST